MRVIMIGGSGFLGSSVAQALAENGHQCTILTRQPSLRRDLRLVPGVQLCRADVYDPGTLRDLFLNADAVISMAGILNERGSDGEGFRRVHVTLVEGIIDACRQSGLKRLLHVSAINAGEGKSHYLQSKGEAEAALMASGLDVTLFRPSVIFGPDDSFFNRFAGLLRLAPVLPLACPNARLQPVYVRDVASAMTLGLDHAPSIGACYELGGPRAYSLQELVRWTAAVIGQRRWIPGLPDPLSRLQAAIMDFVPGKPFSSDNYHSLQLDNVTEDNALPRLGIKPESIEAIVPLYLGSSARQLRLDGARSHQVR